MKKKYLNYTILLVLIGLTLVSIFSNLNLEEFKQILKNADGRYLAVAFGCMLIFWAIEAGIIDALIRRLKSRSDYWTSLKITIIGQYYSYLTPFASGGQPAQLYTMKQNRIPLSTGTAVLVSKFILFQVTVTLYALVLALVKITLLTGSLKSVSSFVFMGLAINGIGLAAIIFIAFKPNMMKKLLDFFIVLLSKWHMLKDPEKKIASVNGFVEDYNRCIKSFKNDIGLTLKMFLATVVQLTVFFSITYFIYKALGLSGKSILDIIALQALLYMAVSFIPTPGSAGASEAGFVLILQSVFTGNLITAALLLWRGISFYLSLIFCGLFTLYIYMTENRKKGKSVVA